MNQCIIQNSYLKGTNFHFIYSGESIKCYHFKDKNFFIEHIFLVKHTDYPNGQKPKIGKTILT